MNNKKILQDEIMSDEELEKVFGGNGGSEEVLNTPKKRRDKDPFNPDGEVPEPKLPPEVTEPIWKPVG